MRLALILSIVMAVPVIADKEAAFRRICPPPSNRLPIGNSDCYLVMNELRGPAFDKRETTCHLFSSQDDGLHLSVSESFGMAPPSSVVWDSYLPLY